MFVWLVAASASNSYAVAQSHRVDPRLALLRRSVSVWRWAPHWPVGSAVAVLQVRRTRSGDGVSLDPDGRQLLIMLNEAGGVRLVRWTLSDERQDEVRFQVVSGCRRCPLLQMLSDETAGSLCA